jgi:hypothetical protein
VANQLGRPLVSVRKSARILTGAMTPHLAHQDQWESRDGGAIHCRECNSEILTVSVIRRAMMFLDPSQTETVRNGIARWIRHHSPDSAKIIVPIHRPG